MINEESTGKCEEKTSETSKVVKNVNIFEYFWKTKGYRRVFNFKYHTLFRSNNYLGIILRLGLGSFQGQFGAHFGVAIISGAVQVHYLG